jgi:hypothetical protein
MTLLALATYIPALTGHLAFAFDQPWFWKHILAQSFMGTIATILSAYTLLTLHEVSLFAQSSNLLVKAITDPNAD